MREGGYATRAESSGEGVGVAGLDLGVELRRRQGRSPGLSGAGLLQSTSASQAGAGAALCSSGCSLHPPASGSTPRPPASSSRPSPVSGPAFPFPAASS